MKHFRIVRCTTLNINSQNDKSHGLDHSTISVFLCLYLFEIFLYKLRNIFALCNIFAGALVYKTPIKYIK